MRKKISGLIIGILLICSFVIAQDTTIHENGMTVNGIIESTNGGIKFPDGSIQSSTSPVFKVYDNNNQYLGLYIARATERVWTYIPSTGEFINISLDTGDVWPRIDLYYQSSNCTGTPYASPSASYGYFRFGSQYYTGEFAAPSSIQVNSMSSSYSCSTTSFTQSLVRALPISPSLTLPVALPLTFQLNFSE